MLPANKCRAVHPQGHTLRPPWNRKSPEGHNHTGEAGSCAQNLYKRVLGATADAAQGTDKDSPDHWQGKGVANEHPSLSRGQHLRQLVSHCSELFLCNSSSIGSDELMRATMERRDALSMVRDELDKMPPDALLSEPMIRQSYPQVPGWLPQLVQIALGGGNCPRLVPA